MKARLEAVRQRLLANKYLSEATQRPEDLQCAYYWCPAPAACFINLVSAVKPYGSVPTVAYAMQRAAIFALSRLAVCYIPYIYTVHFGSLVIDQPAFFHIFCEATVLVGSRPDGLL
jgi:hypothetical protein